MAYVNAPVGEGRRPPAPLLPHLAIPTTPGTGSEATTVAVLDIPDLKLKTGISHRVPAAGAGDRRPGARAHARARGDGVGRARRDLPRGRVVPRAAVPRRARGRPRPDERPPYQGANPVADIWSANALEYGGRFLRRAVARADDVEARGSMMLAATHGGRRLRLGRRAHPARVRLSDRGPEARLPAARLSRRPPVHPARALGHRHGARGLPLHLRGGARAPRARRRAAHRRLARRPRGPARRPPRADARRRRAAPASPRSATTSTTSPRSSRARSSSSGSSSIAPREAARGRPRRDPPRLPAQLGT